jgi:hypothetical protein
MHGSLSVGLNCILSLFFFLSLSPLSLTSPSLCPQRYEYTLGGDKGPWQTCGVSDYVIVDGLHVPSPSAVNVSVRAVNAGGLTSAARHVTGYVDTTAPTTTGKPQCAHVFLLNKRTRLILLTVVEVDLP